MPYLKMKTLLDWPEKGEFPFLTKMILNSSWLVDVVNDGNIRPYWNPLLLDVQVDAVILKLKLFFVDIKKEEAIFFWDNFFFVKARTFLIHFTLSRALLMTSQFTLGMQSMHFLQQVIRDYFGWEVLEDVISIEEINLCFLKITFFFCKNKLEIFG